MKSVGNDIVALKLIDKQRTIQPVFYSKFVTPTELALYHDLNFPFDVFLWMLWSVKESAYKYIKRSQPGLLFSPSKITVQSIVSFTGSVADNWDIDQLVNDFFQGEVVVAGQTLYYISIIKNEFVATIVNDDKSFKDVHWGVRQIEETDSESQSKEVRAFILDKLKEIFPQGGLTIEKSATGYPVLIMDGSQINVQISFSHHYRYVAYSFLNVK